MIHLVAMLALLLVTGAVPAAAQEGLFIRPNCNVPSTFPAPVTGKTWCFNSSNLIHFVWNGAAFVQEPGGGGGSPAGPSTAVQFNAAGSFGGSINLTWSSPTLSVNQGIVEISNITGSGGPGVPSIQMCNTVLGGTPRCAYLRGYENASIPANGIFAVQLPGGSDFSRIDFTDGNGDSSFEIHASGSHQALVVQGFATSTPGPAGTDGRYASQWDVNRVGGAGPLRLNFGLASGPGVEPIVNAIKIAPEMSGVTVTEARVCIGNTCSTPGGQLHVVDSNTGSISQMILDGAASSNGANFQIYSGPGQSVYLRSNASDGAFQLLNDPYSLLVSVSQGGAVSVTNLAGGGTQCLKVDNAGVISGTGSACATGAGTGTVTNTGTLTANRLIIGGGGVDVTALGSLGTTTTVLHGNAAGAPTFGAVVSDDLNITTTSCTNQVVTALSSGAVGTCSTVSNAMLANSSITVNGNSVSLGGSVLGTGTTPQFAGVTLGAPSATTGQLHFKNATNAFTNTIQSGVTAADVVFTWVTADGSAGTCLSTNGSGVLSWANCSSGGTGLTSLNGQTGNTQTFANDTNVQISSAADVHSIVWAGTLAASRGGLGMTIPADNSVPVSNGTAWQAKAIPDCTDTAGQHLNYTDSTNTFSCGTSSTGGISGLTTGRLTKATSSTTIGDSTLSESGSVVTASGTLRGILQDKGGAVFNAAAYGVVCDGSTDDRTAILATKTAAGTTGTILLPASSSGCLIGSAITFSDRTKLCGAGMGRTTLLWGGGTGAEILRFNGADSYLCDLTIDGASTTSQSNVGLTLVGAGTTLERVEVKRVDGAINVAAANVTLSDIVWTGMGSGVDTGVSSTGIYAGNAGGLAATNLLIRRGRGTNWWLPAFFGQGTIVDSYFANNHHQTTPSGGGQVANALISGVAGRLEVVNTIISTGGAGATGIEANGNGFVSGGLIENQPNIGIIFQDSGQTNYVVIGTTIKNSSTTSAGLWPAIRVSAGVTDWQVIGVRAYDDQVSKTQSYGVQVAAGTSSRYVISGDFAGNLTGTVDDQGTGAQKDVYSGTRRYVGRVTTTNPYTLGIAAVNFASDGLHVEGSAANATPTVNIQSKGAATDRSWAIVADGGDGGAFKLKDNTAAATRMTVNTSGNVGIGTAPLFSKLAVLNPGGGGLYVGSTANNDGTGYRFHLSGSAAKTSTSRQTLSLISSNDAANPIALASEIIGNASAASRYVSLYTAEVGTGNPPPHLILQEFGAVGKVGLGLTAPLGKLHVAGDGILVGTAPTASGSCPSGNCGAGTINVSGGYYVNGVLLGGGGNISGALTTGRVVVSNGAASIQTPAAWTWDDTNVGTLLTKTAFNNVAALRVNATVTGTRNTAAGIGTIAIPSGIYGSGGPQQTTYVPGVVISDTDGTTWPCGASNLGGQVNVGASLPTPIANCWIPSGNVGAVTAGLTVDRTLSSTFQGFGIGQIVQVRDNRVIGAGGGSPVPLAGDLPEEQNVYGYISLVQANQTVSGSANFSGAPRIGSVNYYGILSRTSASNASTGLSLTLSNFVAADGLMSGIIVGAGDTADVGTEFTNQDALHVVTKYASATNMAVDGWTNVLRARNPHAAADVIRILNDGRTYLSPSVDANDLLAITSIAGATKGALIKLTHTGSGNKYIGNVSNAFVVRDSPETGTLLAVDELVSANDTVLNVQYNGTLKRVSVGAADSCGTGFRCLRIAN